MKDVGSRRIKCGDSEPPYFRGFNLTFKTSKKIVKFVKNFVFYIYLLFYSYHVSHNGLQFYVCAVLHSDPRFLSGVS